MARERGLPASIVLTDETLVAVEERRPATEPDLRDIPGFRPDKIASYGHQVLAIVAAVDDPPVGEPVIDGARVGDEIVDVRARGRAESPAPTLGAPGGPGTEPGTSVRRAETPRNPECAHSAPTLISSGPEVGPMPSWRRIQPVDATRLWFESSWSRTSAGVA